MPGLGVGKEAVTGLDLQLQQLLLQLEPLQLLQALGSQLFDGLLQDLHVSARRQGEPLVVGVGNDLVGHVGAVGQVGAGLRKRLQGLVARGDGMHVFGEG